MTDTFTTGTQNEEVTRNQWLTSFITGSHEPRETRKQTKLYPSSAGICARRNVLSLTEEWENSFNMSGVFYTTIGDAIHNIIQSGIKKRDPKALIEYQLKDTKLMLSGRADIIMRDPTTKQPFIIDIKSTGPIPKTPKKEHVRQLAIYAILSGIKDTEVYYVSRNVGNPVKMKGYTIDFSGTKYSYALEEVKHTIVYSIIAYQNNLLPERLKHKGNCTYCPFKSLCWEQSGDMMLTESYNKFNPDDFSDEVFELLRYIQDNMETKYKEIDAMV
jgi:CRISPR/Cas system-associated exonuclease Cas4 (RecB family)